MAFTANSDTNPGIFSVLPMDLQVGDYFDRGYGKRMPTTWVKVVEVTPERDTHIVRTIDAQGRRFSIIAYPWDRGVMTWLAPEHRR